MDFMKFGFEDARIGVLFVFTKRDAFPDLIPRIHNSSAP